MALECARLGLGACVGVAALLHRATWDALEEALLEQFDPRSGLYRQFNPSNRPTLHERQPYALGALRHKTLEREQSKSGITFTVRPPQAA